MLIFSRKKQCGIFLKQLLKVGISHFKEKMAGYARQYNLNDADDTICLVVAAIRHQGRARSPVIMTALQSADPLESLLSIGEEEYKDRITTLRCEIESLTNDGIFGSLKYSTAQRDFVRK